MDEFIDVLDGKRIYIPCLYVYNKIDGATMEKVDRLARAPHSMVISCEMDLNIEGLVAQMWEELKLIRIYTKKRGENPDFSPGGALIIRKNSGNMLGVCREIHRSLPPVFNYANVWGSSVKYQPQRVGLKHQVEDEDVVQIVKKK